MARDDRAGPQPPGVENRLDGRAGAVVQTGVIRGDVYIHAKRTAAQVPRQLPMGTRRFTGRTAESAWLDAVVADASPTARPGRGVGHRGRGQDGARPPGARRVAEAFPGGQLYVDLRGYGPEQPVPALEMDRRASGGTAIDLGMPRIAAAQPAQAEGTASLPQSLDDQQCH